MEKFKFTPERGFRDGTAYPNPTSEANTREMFQRPLDQLRDYVNQLLGIIPTDEELQQMVVNHDAIQKLRDDLEYLEEHSNSYAEYDENTGNLQINTVKEVNVTLAGLNELTTQLKNSITQLSNPNLLINSDFRNPINQRGQEIYNADWTAKYSIDRWKIIATTCDINEGCVAFKNGTGEYVSGLFYHFETPLNEDTYTLTIKVKSLTDVVNARVSNILDVGLKEGVNIITLNGSIPNLYFNFSPRASIEIEYIKLEQGAIATPFVPRPYAEEMVMCQRYYHVIGSVRERVQAFAGNNMYFRVHYHPMRTTPKFALKPIGTPGIALYRPSNWSVLKEANTGDITFEGDSSHVDIKVGYYATFEECTLNISNCNIELDAEIY